MGKPTICVGESKGADQLRGKSCIKFQLVNAHGGHVFLLTVCFFFRKRSSQTRKRHVENTSGELGIIVPEFVNIIFFAR